MEDRSAKKGYMMRQGAWSSEDQVQGISGVAISSDREVSLLTIPHPEGFDCVTEGSSMLCVMLYAINGNLVATRDMHAYIWAGRPGIM